MQAQDHGVEMLENVLEQLIMRATAEPAIRSELITMLLGSRVAVPLNRGLENGVLPGRVLDFV